MFIHIAKIVEHANAWLVKKGHELGSVEQKVVQDVINYIGSASEFENARQTLERAGYTVLQPQDKDPNYPPEMPNMQANGIVPLPHVDEPPPGAMTVDGQTTAEAKPDAQ